MRKRKTLFIIDGRLEGGGGVRVCLLPFGNSMIYITEQWSQPLLSVHEYIFNPTNLLFFLLSLYRAVN